MAFVCGVMLPLQEAPLLRGSGVEGRVSCRWNWVSLNILRRLSVILPGKSPPPPSRASCGIVQQLTTSPREAAVYRTTVFSSNDPNTPALMARIPGLLLQGTGVLLEKRREFSVSWVFSSQSTVTV
ncbi:hypothetical protein KIL84_022158 [Mauremys mutica]|uniref:Uncharacterized protein n=1 Tax=Mauremys mutica TaxID=74926 RepID=A0A9D4AYX0_9SAUR|nr:hypothetical protein KIL84_022158 [Mauremys mutica]